MTEPINTTPPPSPPDAVLRVGKGRGFVVSCRNYLGRFDPVIITAAHCLPKKLPPPHPMRYEWEATYRRRLGPLDGKCTVWAACIFVDPVADIAVLGQPDNQIFSEEADAYDALVGDLTPLAIADAPKMGVELLTLPGGRQIKTPAPGKGPAFVLSLDGCRREGRVERRGECLLFKPEDLFVNGMSGSPILDAAGAAIGVVSIDCKSPVIVDTLAAQLVRRIRGAR
jgi:hypothetical protein